MEICVKAISTDFLNQDVMKYPPIFSLKPHRNLLRNRAMRREDTTVRQIKAGKVTKRWETYEVSRESLIEEMKQDMDAGKSLLADKPEAPQGTEIVA